MHAELQKEMILRLIPPGSENFSENEAREYLDNLPRRKLKRRYNQATKLAAKENRQKGRA